MGVRDSCTRRALNGLHGEISNCVQIVSAELYRLNSRVDAGIFAGVMIDEPLGSALESLEAIAGLVSEVQGEAEIEIVHRSSVPPPLVIESNRPPREDDTETESRIIGKTDIDASLAALFQLYTGIAETSQIVAANLGMVRSLTDESKGLRFLENGYLGAASSCMDHLSALVHHAHQVVDVGFVEYNPRPVDIVGVVSDTVSICRGLFDKYDISVTLHRDEFVPASMFFMGDPERMTAVLINIFSNMQSALMEVDNRCLFIGHDYVERNNMSFRTDPEGMVLVDEDGLPQKNPVKYLSMVRISNNGPGLACDGIDRPFDIGYSTTNRPGRGLPAAKGIIEDRFNGTMYFSSTMDGNVEIILELPLLPPRTYEDVA
ncbi:hypothetical protein KY362_02330 [Candidatus Woesearchaeota archaeon]|nr:hypothetical protein [Candidatus Woesearchaeota archaeon]